MDKVLYITSAPLECDTSSSELVTKAILCWLGKHYDVDLVRSHSLDTQEYSVLDTRILSAGINDITVPLFQKKAIRFFTKHWRFTKRLLRFCRRDVFLGNNSAYNRSFYTGLQDIPLTVPNKAYKYIISGALPAPSHHVAEIVIKNNHLKYDKWLQIWFESWEGEKPLEEPLMHEEQRLIRLADAVYYGDIALHTLRQRMFPELGEKIRYFDLPYSVGNFNKGTDSVSACELKRTIKIGYFGNYHSKWRNIRPFYEAMKRLSDCTEVNIAGTSDIQLLPTDSIHIHGRVNHDTVSHMIADSDIVVVLMEWARNKTPGKIYELGLSDKYVMIITDGNKEYIDEFIGYFGQFKRFIITENTSKAICQCIVDIRQGLYGSTYRMPVTRFSTDSIMRQMLKYGEK